MSVNYELLETRLLDADLASLEDSPVSVILNDKTISEDVKSIDTQTLFDSILPADYDALSSLKKSLFHALLGMGSIRVEPGNTRDTLIAMFSGTDSLIRLVTLQTQSVSWADQNWGRNVKVGHVRLARRHIIRRELVIGVNEEFLNANPSIKTRRDYYFAMIDAEVATDLNGTGQAVTLGLGTVIEQHIRKARA